jgi:hypothetical protein
MSIRRQIKTHGGWRFATGECAVCSNRLDKSGIDAAKDAAQGDAVLCMSETGRLAHLCEEHLREKILWRKLH